MKSVLEQSDPTDPILYTGDVIAEYNNSKQHWIILNEKHNGHMLFIDNQHQSTQSDEYLYHESLVHTLMSGLPDVKSVLILGGAEGCLAREVLKWSSVKTVTQVDWDKSLVDYFALNGTHWNENAYKDARLKTVYDDACHWLKNTTEVFDAIFIDLLDPTPTTLDFLQEIITDAQKLVAPRGGLAVNAGIVKKHTVTSACKLAEFIKKKYPENHRVAAHIDVPSYLGEWCFLMIVPRSWSIYMHEGDTPKNVKWYSKNNILHAIQWPKDYPSEIRNYWVHFLNPEKLTTGSPTSYNTKELYEYYGC
jgi:predicted membrane-bound spermidine synthase